MQKLIAIIILSIASNLVYAQLWTGTWATAPQSTTKANMPQTTLNNCAVRQIVRVSIGGELIRLKLSNEYGDGALQLKSIFIADATDSCSIDRKTASFLTFNGKRSVNIPAGSAIYSDPLRYPLGPLQRLAITINYQQSPTNITSHPGSRTTSYIIKGVANAKSDFSRGEHIDHWFNLSNIEVYGNNNEAIAILGNSITDGRGSTTNLQNRWPDIMATAMSGNTGILNLGIGGNCVFKDGLGDKAIIRFDRDILEQSNVKTLIIFEGVNDIGSSNGDSETVAQSLIQAYKDMAAKAKSQGIEVIFATIPPFKGHSYFTFFHEAARQTVNEWIRTSSEAKVIDFDELLRSTDDPQRLKEEWQEDWLHPNAAGYKAMGEFSAKRIKNIH